MAPTTVPAIAATENELTVAESTPEVVAGLGIDEDSGLAAAVNTGDWTLTNVTWTKAN